MVLQKLLSAATASLSVVAALSFETAASAQSAAPSPSSGAQPAAYGGEEVAYVLLKNLTTTLNNAKIAIFKNWHSPKCNEGVKAPVIRIKLDIYGSVQEKHLVQTSGDALLDESAMNAIEYQSPEWAALRSLYPVGAFDVGFNAGTQASTKNPVTIRPVPIAELQIKPGTPIQIGGGDGASRITGKVIAIPVPGVGVSKETKAEAEIKEPEIKQP